MFSIVFWWVFIKEESKHKAQVVTTTLKSITLIVKHLPVSRWWRMMGKCCCCCFSGWMCAVAMWMHWQTQMWMAGRRSFPLGWDDRHDLGQWTTGRRREWEEEEEKSGGASQSRSEGMKVRPSPVYTHIVDSRGVWRSGIMLTKT